MITNPKIGMRARFTGKDRDFDPETREGKLGTIVGKGGPEFGNGCEWQIDGEEGVFDTALEDLTEEAAKP